MSWEQRNADFCKAQSDAEFVYIKAERRVVELEDENAKLRNDLEDANNQAEEVCIENAKLRELVKAMEPFLCCMPFASCNTLAANVRKRMRELGIEVYA